MSPTIDLVGLELLKDYHHSIHTTTYYYESGTVATTIDGGFHHVKYGNGDQIWFSWANGKYTVSKIITHDGLEFHYETTSP